MILRQVAVEASLSAEQHELLAGVFERMQHRMREILEHERQSPSSPQRRQEIIEEVARDFTDATKGVRSAPAANEAFIKQQGAVIFEMQLIEKGRLLAEWSSSSIKLTDEQAAKAKAILTDTTTALRDAPNDEFNGIPRDEKRMMVTLEARGRLRGLLSDEQNAKWEQSLERMVADQERKNAMRGAKFPPTSAPARP
jgi:hypothetical protein